MKRFYRVVLVVLGFALINLNAIAQQKIFNSHPQGSIAEINADDAPFRVGVLHKPMQSQSLVQIYDSIYHLYWDPQNNGWAANPIYKSVNIVYDIHNNLTSGIWKVLNGTSWDNYQLTINTYDINNNQTNSLRKFWNGSAWVNSHQYTFTYSANNNQTGYILQNWDSTVWVNSSKASFFYDINNNLIKDLFENWNTNFNYWMNSNQDTLTYDVNNNKLTSLRQDWINLWKNTQYNIYTYDVNNLLVSELDQTWNVNNWVDLYQGTFIYDVNNNRLSGIYQKWNGSAWINGYQLTYTYDANNFNSSIVEKAYNTIGNAIASGDSIRIFFHTVTGINNLQSSDVNLSISPNPATTTCTITSKLQHANTLTLYDITGRALLQQPFNTTATINISQLTNGIYMAEIKDKEGSRVVGKMVKE